MPMPPDHNVIDVAATSRVTNTICLPNGSLLAALPYRTETQKSHFALVFQSLDWLAKKAANDLRTTRQRTWRLSVTTHGMMTKGRSIAVVDDENMTFFDFSFGIIGFFRALKYLRLARTSYALARTAG
jgi:hypothetical protein